MRCHVLRKGLRSDCVPLKAEQKQPGHREMPGNGAVQVGIC